MRKKDHEAVASVALLHSRARRVHLTVVFVLQFYETTTLENIITDLIVSKVSRSESHGGFFLPGRPRLPFIPNLNRLDARSIDALADPSEPCTAHAGPTAVIHYT